MNGPDRDVVSVPLQLGDGTSLSVTAVSVGNPHCVTFVERLDEGECRRLGPLIERHPAFPNRTNVQFARVSARDALDILIWERGAGYTLASGSSSCGAASAAVRNGLCAHGRVKVGMPGGQLTIEVRPDWSLRLDGPVEEVRAPDLAAALAAVGERLGPSHLASIPPGWSSWSCYFKHVADADVIENVEAARRLELPVEIAQLDDGYEAAIGDWLDARPGFGSLSRLGERIREAGMRAGIWTAPFMVDPESRLAAEHPDWLVQDADAGLHWGRRMRILDVGHQPAAQHLAEVFRTLAAWGFTYHKLDFLYAGAIPGLAAYREGMTLIRDALGPGATVLACGAPLLPTIGLCDAMRIGPDVLPETSDPQPDVESLTRITGLRSWMNGRLWVNDPDHLVARSEIKERQRWAAYVGDYGGVRFSGDRLGELDELGLELTRQVLSNRAR